MNIENLKIFLELLSHSKIAQINSANKMLSTGLSSSFEKFGLSPVHQLKKNEYSKI